MPGNRVEHEEGAAVGSGRLTRGLGTSRAPENPRGHVDRYKASSYAAFNDRLPSRYDGSLIVRLCRVGLMDDFVLEQIGDGVGSLAVLDVGCATGRLLDRLAAAGCRDLAGSDLAPRILEVARERLARRGIEAELRQADAEDSLPWPSRRFDVVTLTGVLHHFLAPAAALEGIERVLRPGGRLILADPCFFTPVREFLNLCLRVHPHDGDCRFHSMRGATRLLETQGWRVSVCRRLNWCFYGLVASRG